MEKFEITNTCDDWEWEDSLHTLDVELKKTHIKRGFLEVLNGGWRGLHGMTPIFDITARGVVSKMGNFDWTLTVEKEGHHLVFTRSSHDEPTGARILLKPASKHEEVRSEIFDAD